MLHGLATEALLRLTNGFDAEEYRDWIIRFGDRLAELDRIARRDTRRPCSQDDLERLDLPLDAGRGVLLYRPSVGGMTWLRTRAAEWWGNDVRRYTLALAYVCAHRDKDAITAVQRRGSAWLRIQAWAIATRCGEEALRRAAIALLPPEDESARWFFPPGENPDGEPIDLGYIAFALAKHCGKAPEYWLWEASEDEFWAAYCSIIDELEAKDYEHKNPDCWWRRQRRAIFKFNAALKADTEKWRAERRAKTQPPAAEPAPQAEPAPAPAPASATEAEDTSV